MKAGAVSFPNPVRTLQILPKPVLNEANVQVLRFSAPWFAVMTTKYDMPHPASAAERNQSSQRWNNEQEKSAAEF